jgi:hypothetical protein
MSQLVVDGDFLQVQGGLTSGLRPLLGPNNTIVSGLLHLRFLLDSAGTTAGSVTRAVGRN